MAVTDFKYSDQDFFRSVAPNYGKYLARLHLKDFVNKENDVWAMHSVGSVPQQVFFDGEGGKNVASAGLVDTSAEWYYDSSKDVLTIHTKTADNDPNDDEMIEAGEDKDTFINKQLVNGAMMLNSLITSVVTPVPKTFIYNDTDATETAEYDYFLKRAECLLAYSNMANAESDFELADRLYEQVTNVDKTGIVDRINDGSIQLANEREAVDSRGRIIRGEIVGSMEFIELSGNWRGQRYEKLKIQCTATGGFGGGKFKVISANSTQLFGTDGSEQFVTGLMQSLGGGLYGRFGGDSMTLGDIWFVEVRNDEPTNASSGSIELWR